MICGVELVPMCQVIGGITKLEHSQSRVFVEHMAPKLRFIRP